MDFPTFGVMRIKAQRIRDTSFNNIYWEFNLNYGKFRFGRLGDGSMTKEWSADLLEIPLGLSHEPGLRDSKKPFMF